MVIKFCVLLFVERKINLTDDDDAFGNLMGQVLACIDEDNVE